MEGAIIFRISNDGALICGYNYRFNRDVQAKLLQPICEVLFLDFSLQDGILITQFLFAVQLNQLLVGGVIFQNPFEIFDFDIENELRSQDKGINLKKMIAIFQSEAWEVEESFFGEQSQFVIDVFLAEIACTIILIICLQRLIVSVLIVQPPEKCFVC